MNEELINKLETAIDYIQAGLPFKVDQYSVGKSNSNRIFVNGYLDLVYFENVSQYNIKHEFDKMKKGFVQLMSLSKKFEKFAMDKGIDYYLLFDTGKAGVEICAEIDGIYKSFV